MKKITYLMTTALLMNISHAANAQPSNVNQPLVPVVPAAMTALNGTYVTFPADTNCNVEYYAGTEANAYVYYGGYFWYPSTEATLLSGYEPTYWNGQYWYASRVHPHQAYVEKQNIVYLLPVEPKGILE